MQKSELNKYRAQYDALKKDRAVWVSTWKQLATYLAPTRGMFEGEIPNSGRRIDHKTLLDSSASLAVNTLGAGLMSGLTSPSRRWFDLTFCPPALSKLPGAGQWLENVKEAIESALAQSNLYCVLQSMYEELAVFGTAAFLVEETSSGKIYFRPFTAGEYVLDVDEKGKVNTFGREFYMTPKQLADKFGPGVLPASILQSLQRQENSCHKVIHLICPNKDFGLQELFGFAYHSLYFLEDGTLL